MDKIKEKVQGLINNHFILLCVGLFALFTFALFFGIWHFPVHNFDEARHGVDAYEMIQEHSFIANYYNGEVDYYNLKPPLSYWLISLSYLIFGYHPFALRFYAAFFSLLGAIILFFYVKHKYGKVASLLSVLAFLGCVNLFAYHGVRSGDADGLFIFLFILGYTSLGRSSEKPQWIYLSGFAFALMFLAKSFHSFVFIPIVFFYLLFTKGFKNIGWWRLVLFFLCALLPIFLWGIARYQFDGWTFISKMFTFDLFQRTRESGFEGHESTVFYYLRAFAFNPPLLISLVLCIIYFVLKIRKKEKLSNEAKLVMISTLSIFGFFSLSKTRLDWYVDIGYIPLIVALAVLLPKFFDEILIDKPGLIKTKKVLEIVVPVVLTGSALVSSSMGFISPLFNKQDEVHQLLLTSDIKKGALIYLPEEYQQKPTQSYLITMEFSFDGRMKIASLEQFNVDDVDNSYYLSLKENLPIDYESDYQVVNSTSKFTIITKK